MEECVGAKKKQGAEVMRWGIIGYGWKVWEMYSEYYNIHSAN